MGGFNKRLRNKGLTPELLRGQSLRFNLASPGAPLPAGEIGTVARSAMGIRSSEDYLMASKPAARSAMMSSMFSVPMDRRTVVGLMPAASSSSSVSWECVVEAG